MSDALVRARVNGFEKNVGAAFAKAKGLEVLDEPTRNPDGSPRRTTRRAGRPVKEKTSVTKKAAEKKVPSPEVAVTAEEATV